MRPQSRRGWFGVTATVAALALVSAAIYLRHLQVCDDGEMLKRQIELQWLQELSKIESQQQSFWREHGVVRCDLVGVDDTICYDRAYVKTRSRFGDRLKPLDQLDAPTAAAFESLAAAAADATLRRCLEFLPKMQAELSEEGLGGGTCPRTEEIQRRWMLACRAHCTRELARLAETHTPTVTVVQLAECTFRIDH